MKKVIHYASDNIMSIKPAEAKKERQLHSAFICIQYKYLYFSEQVQSQKQIYGAKQKHYTANPRVRQ